MSDYLDLLTIFRPKTDVAVTKRVYTPKAIKAARFKASSVPGIATTWPSGIQYGRSLRLYFLNHLTSLNHSFILMNVRTSSTIHPLGFSSTRLLVKRVHSLLLNHL